MADVLIRNVPDEVIAAVDAKAKRLGLSRTEYLRRTLERERQTATGPIGVAQLVDLAAMLKDLNDPTVMDDAWS